MFLQGVADERAWETFFGAAMPTTAAGLNRTDALILNEGIRLTAASL
jgi:hypothetical protein